MLRREFVIGYARDAFAAMVYHTFALLSYVLSRCALSATTAAIFALCCPARALCLLAHLLPLKLCLQPILLVAIWSLNGGHFVVFQNKAPSVICVIGIVHIVLMCLSFRVQNGRANTKGSYRQEAA